MRELIKKLMEPLQSADIEFRIGNASPKKGFNLLAYKTARVDVARLNEVAGMNWRNSFFYDTQGLLCAEISIYNDSLAEWVSRCDIGTESKTEKEKGLYSDAFKRAAFKWGIGAELYAFPFIWINWDKWRMSNGKEYPDFNAGDITIDDYFFENGAVKKLKLSYRNEVIFNLGAAVKKEPTAVANPFEKEKAETIGGYLKGKIANIPDFCEKNGINAQTAAAFLADKQTLNNLIELYNNL